MPNKCGVYNCKGNYYQSTKCRVFKLPKNEEEKALWISKLPPRADIDVSTANLFICEHHWPSSAKYKAIPGGNTRPVDPPSIFDVPPSCLPSAKPLQRPSSSIAANQESYFNSVDKIVSFEKFSPEAELKKSTAQFSSREMINH